METIHAPVITSAGRSLVSLSCVTGGSLHGVLRWQARKARARPLRRTDPMAKAVSARASLLLLGHSGRLRSGLWSADEKSPRAGGGSAELLGGMARTTTGSGNYTRITFSPGTPVPLHSRTLVSALISWCLFAPPDLVRFGVKGGKGLAGEADLLAVMHRRVVDVAALVGEQGVKVSTTVQCSAV